MSTTLTNGLKLPDKGSVDWYADMQSNYAILDGAVGTVAEHTTQIAGKAPAVHTHTKSDITDFPAYGNAAGTICEGNDSRLSDARTPVAHTHGKADVTDLLNSNFIPSVNNSYDLGSSSYQWNNLYAKNYYYNGTAWGLDKANTWTGDNTFSGSNSFNSGLTINNAALLNAVLQNAVKGDVSTTGDFAIFIKDKVNGNAASSLLAVYRGGQDSGGSYAQVNIDTKGNDNNRYNNSILFRINPADNSNNAVFIPQRDKTIDLGTSTNKWKTLNGVNPGALSLPNSPGGTGTENVNYFDLSGIVTIRDGSGVNSYQPVCDGWIAINSFATWIQIANDTTLVCVTGAIGADGFGQCYLPVRKNDSIRILINQTNTNFQSFKLIPCQGNV